MTNLKRIYLDNAATSWPKPAAVYEAVDDYQRRLGTSVGRSGYREAETVGKVAEETRGAVARLVGAENPSRIIFTFNGTDSLNLAIHGLLNRGDHVVTSVVEHNSVLRPLRRLEKRGCIEVTRVGCNVEGVIDPNEIRAAIRPATKLVILIHASNVTGAIQPVAEVGRIAREHGVLFLVDAAQTLGHMPVSATELGADLLAAPGHKGLLGPLGTGILYIRPGIENLLNCVRQGGTGSASSHDAQPESLPEKYESGSHNAPGIIGLGEGIRYLEQRGIEEIRNHCMGLTEHMLDGLSKIPQATIFGPRQSEEQVGVVSFSLAGLDPPMIAQLMDDKYRIQARAGFQCAALMHRSLGTLESNGTVRFSIGPFNTEEDVENAISAVASISKSETKHAAVSCPCVSGDKINDDSASVIAAGTSVIPAPQLGQPMDISSIPGLRELWNETLGDPEVRIAVLDGPVDMSHPSLAEARLATIGEANGEPLRVGAASFHGTHVASVIFAQHSSSIQGIAPNCTGLLRPIFSDDTDGSLHASSQEELAQAIEDAVTAGSHVINISGGEPSPNGEIESKLSKAIRECEEKGILVIAAAGNGDCPGLHACECMHTPAASPTVLAVGAMDERGHPLPFSNCGVGYAQHGLLAPGARIPGAMPGHETTASTGTSYAAPVVAGIAALLLSLQKKLGHKPNGLAVREALLKSVDPCISSKDVECRRFLGGRLNIPKAVSLITQGVRSMNPEQELLPAGCGCQATAAPQPVPNEDEPREYVPDRQLVSATNSTFAPATFAASVKPSSCIADSSGQLVYAIGKLAFDFATTGNRDSLQSNIPAPQGFPLDVPLQITDTFGLLAYLLGYRVLYQDPKSKPTKPGEEPKWIDGGEVCGNLHDAAYVTWVLTQNDCPKYVIRPQGAYEEAGYLELIRFMIEQNDFRKFLYMPGCKNDKQEYLPFGNIKFQLRGDCLKSYYCCHGGAVCPCGAIAEDKEGASEETSMQILAESVGLQYSAAEYIAFAGELCGTKKLFNGSALRVIAPAMRSTASWNLIALMKAIDAIRIATGKPKLSDNEKAILLSLIATLAEQAFNDGITPEERAFNFGSTQVVEVLSTLLSNQVFLQVAMEEDLLSLGFDSWTIVPAKCKDVDTLPYDVSLIFYNVNSLRPNRVFVTFTVNVADVNPVVIGRPTRISIRR